MESLWDQWYLTSGNFGGVNFVYSMSISIHLGHWGNLPRMTVKRMKAVGLKIIDDANMKGWMASKDVRGLPGWIWQWCFIQKECGHLRNPAPESERSWWYLWFPNLIIPIYSIMILQIVYYVIALPSSNHQRALFQLFFRAGQFWIGQLSRALPIGLGVWSWETAAALEQAVTPWW